MNSHRALYEQYLKGSLPDEQIAELNQLLIENYFHAPGELNQDELLYTEDFLFESYASKTLQDPFNTFFHDRLSTDPVLSRKYRLACDLMAGTATGISGKSQALAETEANEALEEEQLKSVLGEVLERVHNETDSALQDKKSETILLRIGAFIKNLIPAIPVSQPGLRVALAFASLLLLLAIAWLLIQPGKEKQVTQKDEIDTIQHKPPLTTDSINLKTIRTPLDIQRPQYASDDSTARGNIPGKPENYRKKKTIEKRQILPENHAELLAFVELPESFEVLQTRSGPSSDIADLYLQSAESYNNKDYDNCISVLSNLLKGNYYKSSDTLNEMHYFLGNCYFAKGIDKSNSSLLEIALQYYEEIDPGFISFNDVEWYKALALIILGDNEAATALLDSLMKYDFAKSSKVRKLRDRIN